MKPDKLTGKVPLPKHRAGVHPTRKERDKSKDHDRLQKHKTPILPVDSNQSLLT